MSNELQKNLNLVLMVDKALFIDHDLTILDKYFTPNYIEHSPLPKNIKQLISESGEALKHDVKRVWADTNLVALHGCYKGLAGTPLVGFDIYRVEHGKIIEHWDGLVAEQPANISGRKQLDGDISIKDLDKTEKNRQLVTAFFNDVLMDQNYQHITKYTNGSAFKQHSAELADGSEAMQHFLIKQAANGTPLIYKKLHKTIAQGHFVMTLSEGEFQKKRTAYFELWRVENNKIVELWNAINPIPNDDKTLHPYGLF